MLYHKVHTKHPILYYNPILNVGPKTEICRPECNKHTLIKQNMSMK